MAYASFQIYVILSIELGI